MESVQRKIFGSVLFIVSVINLTVDYFWLRTGNIHRPHFHFVMKGEWFGFWTTVIIFSVLLTAGVYLLLTAAPSFPNRGLTQLSDVEKRRLAIWSKSHFYWIVVDVAAIFFLPFAASNCPELQVPLAVFMSVLVLWPIYSLHAGRCPNCGFPIIYNRHPGIGLPGHCKKCQIALR